LEREIEVTAAAQFGCSFFVMKFKDHLHPQ
jgi:hypothetical protein